MLHTFETERPDILGGEGEQKAHLEMGRVFWGLAGGLALTVFLVAVLWFYIFIGHRKTSQITISLPRTHIKFVQRRQQSSHLHPRVVACSNGNQHSRNTNVETKLLLLTLLTHLHAWAEQLHLQQCHRAGMHRKAERPQAASQCLSCFFLGKTGPLGGIPMDRGFGGGEEVFNCICNSDVLCQAFGAGSRRLVPPAPLCQLITTIFIISGRAFPSNPVLLQ